MALIPLITSAGLVTPLGACLGENWSALRDGQFIRDHATVGGFDRTPRLQALALQAALEACGGAGLSERRGRGVRTSDPVALVVGTSKGPVTDWLGPPAGAIGATSDNAWSAGGANPANPSFGLSDLASYLAPRLGTDGPVLTLSAACASGLHALIRATLLVLSGEVRRAVVVAAESSVHPLFLGCFSRLGVLASEGAGCRPLDTARGGFLVSEAAAAVVIEGVDPGQPVPDDLARRSLVRIERFALGADATHLTGGDPDAKPLRRLLEHVVDGRPVDLIHAHGTATVVNDAVELSAIESTIAPSDLAEELPNLYSHKGALGHSLGAAGLVSVVLNCASHRHGIILPNVRTTSPLPARRVLIDRQARRRPVRRSLAIAAGFGGAMAAVSLVGT